MFQLRFDPTSPYTVRMPRNHQKREIVSLTQKFVAYEWTRPEEARTPLTNRLAALLDEAIPHVDHRRSSERRRTAASEAVKRLDDEARALTHQIWTTMNFLFKTTPERAQDWGFEVRQSTRRINKPKSREERLVVLAGYVAQAESRPDYERFSMPPLADVKRVVAGLTENLSARHTGQTQREISIVRTEALADEMYNHLQSAAVYLLTEEFKYIITPDLKKWGFDVVSIRNSNGNGNGNGHANGNGSNGSGSHG
ncbi:MAG TPA: hypothetical protein PKE64_21080 [Anaerolineae bacterium]|nr:hypothetical protein [Anaerolineae bacterium]